MCVMVTPLTLAFQSFSAHVIFECLKNATYQSAKGTKYDTCAQMHKATPNNFLDSHPNFVNNWGRLEVFIFFIFRTALKTEQC